MRPFSATVFLGLCLAEICQLHADSGEHELFADEIPKLQIQISDAEYEKLIRDLRSYVKATVTEGGKVYTDVGIHAKGGQGSFRPLDRNPSLTLNFDKFHQGQHFHGMDKIHLNNSVQDPTFMTENICRRLFRAAGLPATRAGNARVELNARDLGLYVLVEGVDKRSLKRFFENPNGNLYEGGMRKDVFDPLRKTSGENAEDRADLQRLGQTLKETNLTRRLAHLNEILDVEQFISFMAMEVLLVHWDGYSVRPNNYRIYHDPATGRMAFIPHGMDQMFWEPSAPLLPNFDGLVAKSVMEIPELRARYVERISAFHTNVLKTGDLTNRIDAWHATLRPVLQQFNAEIVGQHDLAVVQLKERITRRATSVAAQLEALHNPLRFATDGSCRLYGWEPRNEFGNALLERTASLDGRQTLRIAVRADTACVASWRSTHTLPAGRYLFAASVQTKGVISLNDGTPEGAGIRISAPTIARSNKAVRDTPWTTSQHEFLVDRERPVEFICELRALSGEAWFDLTSLKLYRHLN